MTAFAVRLHPAATVTDDPATRAAIRARLERLGPDGFGEVRSGRAELRQAVLASDPERPVEAGPRTLDGRHWIVGEIRVDGRADLIAALRQHGAALDRDAPDDALVLHAYAIWGEGCAEHVMGEYGFAIWDAANETLFAVRDRVGARSVAYARLPDGGWLVANAVGPLLAHPGVDRALDPVVVGDILTVGYSLTPERSVYAAIDHLPPAHALTLGRSGARVRRYWQAPLPHVEAPGLSVAARIERFDAVLGEAVRDRVRGARVAVSLSGGIDSTLVAALARREGARAVETFSLGFDWLIADTERHFAAVVAQHLGVPFNSVSVDEVPLDTDNVWQLPPEPRFTLRRRPGHLLAGLLVEKGHRLALNGMGGDAVGAGVSDYWARLIRERRWRELGRSWGAYRAFFGERPPTRLSLQRSAVLRRIPPPAPPAWLRPDFAADTGLVERIGRYKGGERLRDQRITLTQDPFWAEMLLGLSPEGAGGIPLRHTAPLLDARVVEAALGLPPAPFLHRKTILREVARPLLPAAIAQRGKSPLRDDPNLAAARRGAEPCRSALRDPGPVDAYVDRAALLGRLDRLDRFYPSEYSSTVERVAGFSQWLRALAADAL